MDDNLLNQILPVEPHTEPKRKHTRMTAGTEPTSPTNKHFETPNMRDNMRQTKFNGLHDEHKKIESGNNDFTHESKTHTKKTT